MAYVAQAVSFDGASLLYKTGLVGTPSSLLTASCWFNCRTATYTNRTKFTLFQANAADWDTKPGGTTIFLDGNAGKFFVYPRDSTGDNGRLAFATDTTSINEWHHLLCSIDVSSGYAIQYYLDDAPIALSESFTDGVTPFDIDLFEQTITINDWKVSGSTQPAIQDMADVWIASGVALDFSDVANRRKFRDADGLPVSLGSDGSTPTGTAPTMFFSGDASAFATNKGTGGAFTLVGTLADAIGPNGGAIVTSTDIIQLPVDYTFN